MDSLIRKRGVIKASFTRLDNSVTTLLNNENATSEEFKKRLDRAVELFSEFNNIQAEIENLLEIEELELQNKEREYIEENYYTICAKCKSKINDINNHNNDNSPNNISSTPINQNFQNTMDTLVVNQTQLTSILHNLTANRQANSNTSHVNLNESEIVPKINLPTLQIPTFTGDYREWPSFCDIYQSVVHNNSALSATQKFQYLKLALKGEAESTLKHLPISEVNYESAFNILQKKYDKEDYLIEAHLQTLMDCSPVKHASADNLRILSNTFNETVRALEAIKLPVSNWDCWLNFLLVSKLDKESQQLWRRETASTKRPNFDSLLQYLEKRIYELSTAITSVKEIKADQQVKQTSTRFKYSHATSIITCVLCSEPHPLYKCTSYLKLNHKDRGKILSKQGLCFNCMKGKHMAKNCNNPSRCKHCNGRHHSTLHDNVTESTKVENITSLYITKSSTADHANILPTVIVLIRDISNNLQPCRALLDTGSQLTLISEACAQRLRLKRSKGHLLLSGIGDIRSKQNSTKGRVHIKLLSKYNTNSLNVVAYVLPKLTHNLPPVQLTTSSCEWFKNIGNLADPEFDVYKKIDIILGCDAVFDILQSEKRSYHSLKAYNTLFGWVLTGKSMEQEQVSCLHALIDIDNTLQKFWEIESIDTVTTLSNEDQECENHFASTCERLSTGQYMLRLPFKDTTSSLGESTHTALNRLHSMEKSK